MLSSSAHVTLNEAEAVTHTDGLLFLFRWLFVCLYKIDINLVASSSTTTPHRKDSPCRS